MILIFYLFVLLSQISIESLIGFPFSAFGFPISTWLFFGLYLISIVYAVVYIIRNVNRNGSETIRLFFFIIVVVVVTLFSGLSRWTDFFKYSIYYCMPILLYAFFMEIRFDYRKTILTIGWIIIISGVVALLFLCGILQEIVISDIDKFTRSSTMIDGGFGLIGISLALYYLLFDQEMFKPWFPVLLLIAGILIVASGQSRARIMTVIIIVFYFLILRAIDQKKQTKVTGFLIIFYLIIALIVSFLLIPDFKSYVYELVVERFSTLGNDKSTTARQSEIQAQMNLFKASPFFGIGWEQVHRIVSDSGDTFKSCHNMYSSVLCMGGITFAFSFFEWLLHFIAHEISAFRSFNNSKLHLALFITIGCLSVGSAGFGKFSMVIAISIIYIGIISRDQPTEKPEKIKRSIYIK